MALSSFCYKLIILYNAFESNERISTLQNLLPDYISPNTSGAELLRERKQKADKRWRKEVTFATEEEALKFVHEENCWSKLSTNKSYNGDSVLYRCNKVKARAQQCDFGLYLFYHADSLNVSLYRSANDHNCTDLPPAGKVSMSEEPKSILQHLDNGLKRKEIMNALYVAGVPAPSKNQLNNFIAKWNKNKNGPSNSRFLSCWPYYKHE